MFTIRSFSILALCLFIAIYVLEFIIPTPKNPDAENSYSKEVQVGDSCSKETYTIRTDDSTGIQIVFQDANANKRLLKLENALTIKDSEILYLKCSIDSLKLKDKQIIRQYKSADKKLFTAMDTLIVW